MSKLFGHDAGLPGWTMLPKGNGIRNSRCPIHKLQARSNRTRARMGKDGLWARTDKDRLQARTGKDRLWARMGKDNDGLGQQELDANSSR